MSVSGKSDLFMLMQNRGQHDEVNTFTAEILGKAAFETLGEKY
jgi:hypothetical protein